VFDSSDGSVSPTLITALLPAHPYTKYKLMRKRVFILLFLLKHSDVAISELTRPSNQGHSSQWCDAWSENFKNKYKVK
jgi:hypothetical protein